MNLELKVIPVVQVLICAGLIIVIDKLLPQFSYHFGYSGIMCFILVIVSLIIAIKAVLDFRHHNTTVNPTKPEETSSVVDTGIYAWSRNPMYLAMLITVFAIAVAYENWLAYLCVPLFYAYISRFQIVPEERALTRLFAQQYIAYQQKVRRWL